MRSKTRNAFRLFFFPILSLVVFCLYACYSLDDFLFSPQTTGRYEFDDYRGEQELPEALDRLKELEAGELAAVYSNGYVYEYEFSSGAEKIWGVLIHTNDTLSSNDTLIVYFHGTTGNLDFKWPRIRLIFASGYPVFAIDYQGYGKSTGEPSEENLYQDGRHTLAFLKNELGNPNLVLYGQSLGTLVSTEIADSVDSDKIVGLINETPISSGEAMVQDASFLAFPGHYLSTVKGDNQSKLKKISSKSHIRYFMFHGRNDDILSYRTHAQPCWQSYTGNDGLFITLRGGGHADLPRAMGYAHYIFLLKKWLERDDDAVTNRIASLEGLVYHRK